jgi:hypothetical protein
MSTFARLVLLAALLAARAAPAHEMTMAELELRESVPGEFLFQWGAGEKRAPAEELTLDWPGGCVAAAGVRAARRARGTLAVEGIGQTSAALVKVFWLDGGSRVYTFTAAK